MSRTRRIASAVLLALASILAAAPLAFADALVHVKVRGEGAADGQVTLTAVDGGQTHTCRTRRRECRIDGVPGGQYRVELRPARGEPPPARTAMIPPSGTVTLFVSAGTE